MRPDSTVECWGRNNYGISTPPAGAFSQVNAGSEYACGIRPDGTVECWGIMRIPGFAACDSATTTSTTTTPTSTTSTTTLWSCTIDADCDDADPCTVDSCVSTIWCINVHVVGFDGADCELQKLVGSAVCGNDPVHWKLQRVLDKKVPKARRLLQKARSTTKAKKARKFLKKCNKQLRVIFKTVKKTAKKRKITEDCRDTLNAMAGMAQQIVLELRL
jgi:hypothetical protein